MEKFNVNACTKFSVIKELNSEFTLTKVYVMACGKNRNMSYIGKDRVEANLNTLNYVPVVGHLFKDDDGNYRLGGHDFTIDENYNFVSLCVPFGVVMENSFDWEIVNEYGTDVEYLTANAVLWTGRYPDLKEAIYSDDVYFNQSMELNVNQYRVLEEDSNFVELLDFSFDALCLLNKSDAPEDNVEPCFISARVEPVNFNADDFTAKLEELKTAINKCFNLQKEGEELDNTNVTEPVVMENTIDETTEPIVESTNETEVRTEATFSISDFQLTANEKWEKIGTAVRSMGVVTNESDTWFYLEDFDDDFAYVEKCFYDYASDTITRNYGRVSYSLDDNKATINSNFEEMRVMWLTLDEADALEEARNNYSAVLAEIETLRPYKLAAEKTERENAENGVFAKYDSHIGSMPEYVELKTKSGEYSIEELERECLILVGKFAMSEPKNESVEPEIEPTITFALDNTPETKISRYGDVYETYKTK